MTPWWLVIAGSHPTCSYISNNSTNEDFLMYILILFSQNSLCNFCFNSHSLYYFLIYIFYLFFRNYELLLQCSPGNHEVTLHQLIQYHMWRYRSSAFSLRNNHYTTNKERAQTPVSARSHFSLRMHTSFPWPKTKEVRLTPNDLSRNNNFPHLNYGNTSCLSFPCHLVSQLE